MNFITKSTKTNCIVASVITGLLLITLVMLSTLITISNSSKIVMSLIYTVSLLLVMLIWEGIIKIKVFADYKYQNKMLCADGIISICMGVLLIVCSILFGTLQASKALNGVLLESADIRIFLTIFLAIVAIWKGFIAFQALKQKHFNSWCEFVFTALWLILAVLCLITMLITKIKVIAWIIISIGWLLIMFTLFYMIFSYTIKVPNYLQTDKAVEIYEEEQEEIQREQEIEAAKLNKKLGIKVNREFTIKEKLKKLKDLKDCELISEKEYEKKKAEVLSEF